MDCPQIGDTGEESDTQDSQLETGKAYVQVEKEITAKARKQALEKAKEAAKKSLAALGPCPATCPNVTMTVSFGPRTEISSLYTSKPNFFGSTSPRCKAVATCGWSVKRICS